MADEKMQRWVTDQDGVDKLRLETKPIPEPGENEVLVRISSVSLNYRDTEVCRGEYKHHALNIDGTVVPCSDMVGKIARIGANVKSWKVGDRVLSIPQPTHQTGRMRPEHVASSMGYPTDGVLTEYRIFAEQGVVRCPDYLTNNEAACVPVAGVSAWLSINPFSPIGKPFNAAEFEAQEGRKPVVLIQGTGGVAIAGLQIAKASGCEVIVTSSSDEKLQRVKELGADHGINYKTHLEWEKQVNKITNNIGADIIFENGGLRTLKQSTDCVAFGGLITCIGYLAGKDVENKGNFDVSLALILRNSTLHGLQAGSRERVQEMVDFYDQHKIRPVFGRAFPFNEANKALLFLEAGSHFSKVVVQVEN